MAIDSVVLPRAGRVRFEQRFGIGAALAGMLRHDDRVAGKFLVAPERQRGNVYQRIKPEDALERGLHEVCDCIAPDDMDPLMRDDEGLLGGRILRREIVGDDDDWVKQADRRRAATAPADQHTLGRLQDTGRAPESPCA